MPIVLKMKLLPGVRLRTVPTMKLLHVAQKLLHFVRKLMPGVRQRTVPTMKLLPVMRLRTVSGKSCCRSRLMTLVL